MDKFSRFRHHNGNFSETPFKIIRTTDFVVVTTLQQIDLTKICVTNGFQFFNVVWNESKNIGKLTVGFAIIPERAPYPCGVFEMGRIDIGVGNIFALPLA